MSNVNKISLSDLDRSILENVDALRLITDGPTMIASVNSQRAEIVGSENWIQLVRPKQFKALRQGTIMRSEATIAVVDVSNAYSRDGWTTVTSILAQYTTENVQDSGVGETCKCGTSYTAGDTYCSGCGSQLSKVDQGVQPTPPEELQSEGGDKVETSGPKLTDVKGVSGKVADRITSAYTLETLHDLNEEFRLVALSKVKGVGDTVAGRVSDWIDSVYETTDDQTTDDQTIGAVEAVCEGAKNQWSVADTLEATSETVDSEVVNKAGQKLEGAAFGWLLENRAELIS